MPRAMGDTTILTMRTSGAPLPLAGVTSIASPARSCELNFVSTPCTVVPLLVMRPMPSKRVGGV